MNLFIFLVHFLGDLSRGGSRRGMRNSARIGCMSESGGSPGVELKLLYIIYYICCHVMRSSSSFELVQIQQILLITTMNRWMMKYSLYKIAKLWHKMTKRCAHGPCIELYCTVNRYSVPPTPYPKSRPINREIPSAISRHVIPVDQISLLVS